MKSTVTFKQYFYENMTAGEALGGSVGGYSPDNPFSQDFYNPGSAILPKGGAVYTRRGKLKRKAKRKNKRKK